jgi:flagellar hook protein FlgE
MTVRSLAAADAGINTMQTMIDTIGNNIANANTDGYKSTVAQFSDVLTQTINASSSSAPGLASTNPSVTGSGDQLAGITTNFSEGAISQTGVASNAAIEGNGFFVLQRAGQTIYTRNGDFQLDVNGTLETTDGAEVMGWAPGVPTSGPLTPVSVPSGLTIAPKETANFTIGGNLQAGSSQPETTTYTLFDSQGNSIPLTLTFTPGASNNWTLQPSVNGTNVGAPISLAFDSSGQLTSINGAAPGTAGPTSIALSFAGITGFQLANTTINLLVPEPGGTNAVTQYAQGQTVNVVSQDGSASGSMESYSIGQNGVINATFSNGATQALGTIALASFTNPGGLADIGNLEYQVTAASGNAQLGAPGTGNGGTLMGGALEQSNVDLASQLTDLIEAQTDYQADTKVVSTTQTVLQALVTNA